MTEELLAKFYTCGPIMQEVLQGLRFGVRSEEFRERFLALPRLCDPLRWTTFLEAAEIYQQGRRSGYTIRSSADCLIAAIAIENGAAVWHKDRDFSFIARYTKRQAFEPL